VPCPIRAMEKTMKNLTWSLMVGASLVLPFAAFAQQSADTQYCLALGAQYDRYVNNPDMGRGSTPPNAGIGEAKTQCASNPAAGISTLERALKDAKVALPPHG
jgi:hypothetical protein